MELDELNRINGKYINAQNNFGNADAEITNALMFLEGTRWILQKNYMIDDEIYGKEQLLKIEIELKKIIKEIHDNILPNLNSERNNIENQIEDLIVAEEL